MGGYWIDSPDNPFNQMSYTRGGGGYDNRDTHESNDRRAHAMEGSGAGALPHFATAEIAQAYYPGKGYAVVGGDTVIRTTGPGASGASTQGGSGGAGSGSAGVATGKGAGGAGAGSGLVLAAGRLKAVMSDENTGWMIGGRVMLPHPSTSDMEQVETRLGDPEFLSPAWFASWGISGMDTWYNLDAERGGILYTDKIASDLAALPTKAADAAMEGARFLDASKSAGLPTGGGAPKPASVARPNPFGFYAPSPFVATPEAELPNPMQIRPMSAW